ncbi:hypothetical protein EGW08_022894 [Elysia chlorotica]|uniref:Ig-like domain-containing protein n=1 Tax=Elysia chlorotica TaxID=188477 RepID=A0A433SJR5_ELYCH|nr:hypothetical protein EGW08_022894 [Elysia chlorotica]
MAFRVIPILFVVASINILLCCEASFDLKFSRIVPTPPTLPQHFSASFAEIEVFLGKVISKNNGTWYYDYANQRARFDHGEGQRNNFCGGQGLSPKNSKAPCSIIFTPEEDLIILYRESMTCCRLCGKEEGCTILKPDWMKNGSKLLYEETINGDDCYGYGKKGAVTTYDVLYSDVSGFMCRYHEVVVGITHNLTFFKESYNFDPQPDYLFEVPQWCNKACPHPYKPPHQH